MSIKAIIYTTNTGYTEKYAKFLGERIGIAVYDLETAIKEIAPQSDIIYFGWLMGGLVRGYHKASKNFNVKCVCGTCMGATGSQTDNVRRLNSINESISLFTLQAGFDMKKMKGIYKPMMKMMSKKILKDIDAKEKKNDADLHIVEMLTTGAEFISEEDLKMLIDWYDNYK